MACNERCPFCNVPVEDYSIRTPPFETSQKELQQYLDAGEKTLTISGGEPTLYRKRLTSLARQAKEGGMQFIEVQTNATLIDDSYAQELREAGVTSAFVSLLSHIPELHDELAGMEDAFDLCLRGIDALIKHEIRVALNPVTALKTQELIPDYIDFVAKRLPGVTSISLSAVQPHGRAAQNLDLLPNYMGLKATVGEAQTRAAKHQIELLNPYCGLPLCIGWHGDLERCVEVFEAEAGGFNTPGLQNLGNKSQGTPCVRCSMRTRCGGAWHAYWDVRNGSGLAPPSIMKLPWEYDEQSTENPLTEIVSAPSSITDEHWAQLKQSPKANRGLWVQRLNRKEARTLLHSRCTDVFLEADVNQFMEDKETLRALRQLATDVAGWQPQHRVLIWIGLYARTREEIRKVEKAALFARALGAKGIRILGELSALDGVVYSVLAQDPDYDIERVVAVNRITNAK